MYPCSQHPDLHGYAASVVFEGVPGVKHLPIIPLIADLQQIRKEQMRTASLISWANFWNGTCEFFFSWSSSISNHLQGCVPSSPQAPNISHTQKAKNGGWKIYEQLLFAKIHLLQVLKQRDIRNVQSKCKAWDWNHKNILSLIWRGLQSLPCNVNTVG